MTFDEFLVYVREHIGNYCTDAYWKWTFDTIKTQSREEIIKEMPYLAINAIGTDYASRRDNNGF